MMPIWIVDDDRSIRWVLEKALAREGMAFNSFASATEALAALREDSPEVLVSDVRMPGPSGLELLQKLKGKHPDVPVIVMTAYSTSIGGCRSRAAAGIPAQLSTSTRRWN